MFGILKLLSRENNGFMLGAMQVMIYVWFKSLPYETLTAICNSMMRMKNICYWKIIRECESATIIHSPNQNALNFFMANAEWPVKINE